MFNNLGIRHIALNVRNFEECFRFYSDVLGMSVDWKPDNENVYLTNGVDNLALHHASDVDFGAVSSLDHFGFFVKTQQDLHDFYDHIKNKSVPIVKELKKHRDNSMSFYIKDPDNNILQILWHPTLSNAS